MYQRGEIVAFLRRPHFSDKLYAVQCRFDDNDEKHVSSDEPREHENGEGHITESI